MTRIERSIEILLPAEKIFPMLNWERCTEWYDAFKKVTRTSEIANGVGETVHIIGEVAGIKAEWDGETTESVLNQDILGNLLVAASLVLVLSFLLRLQREPMFL